MSNLITSNGRLGLPRYRSFSGMLDDFFNDTWFNTRENLESFKLDVKENDTAYCVVAEMPGVNKEDISISLGDGILSIVMEKKEEYNEEKENYVHRERKLSTASRSIMLPKASAEGIRAKLENGLLNIEVPKEAEINRRIEIE